MHPRSNLRGDSFVLSLSPHPPPYPVPSRMVFAARAKLYTLADHRSRARGLRGDLNCSRRGPTFCFLKLLLSRLFPRSLSVDEVASSAVCWLLSGFRLPTFPFSSFFFPFVSLLFSKGRRGVRRWGLVFGS